MNVELISKTIGLNSYEKLDNNEIIAAIARHGTVKENGGKLVKYLMDNAHWSPLQHISFGFKIETRRSISAQIFRHRSLNGQEWSLRYAEPLGFEEIELRKEHPTNRQSSTEVFNPGIAKYFDPWTGEDMGDMIDAQTIIKEYLQDIESLYNRLLKVGVARECARDILPLCTKTTIHITGTLRDLLGFLNVRCDEHAQKEVRDIATRIGEELEKELPEIMSTINWRNGLFM
jgi:thymidylate synthase (FAD)